MRTHIQTVVSRYRGKIASWYVVNEAIDDAGPDLRPSGWLAACGPDFIAEAFAARAADPDAVLLDNDYNIESPRKLPKLLRLVDDLRARNAPLGAVGIQGHWEVDRVPLRDIAALLDAMEERRLKVMVSERDLGLVPRGPWYANDGKDRAAVARTDPLAAGCPPDRQARQARQYAELFQLFADHADSIGRVTFWDLHDGRSWLNDFPWRHAEYPLLFDRAAAPKPAYQAVMGVR